MLLFKTFKIKTLILLALSIWAHELHGQNHFFLGEKSYSCTKSFNFESDSEYSLGQMDSGSPWFKGPLNILIARDRNRGLLVLSRETVGKMLIKGTVFVYLEDGTVIKCIERGINDYVNDRARSVYYLTGSEIKKIEKTNIKTIRYSVPQLRKDFTTTNKTVNVSKLVSNLFKNK